MKHFTALLLFLLVVACSPSPTATPLPTQPATPAPPTLVLPSAFPTPTYSPTPVPTAINTPSSTPDAKATEAQMVSNVMATLTAAAPTLTPTPTRTLTPLPPTATPTFSPNRISGFNAKDLSARQVRVNADYFYNGEWGVDKVFITASANTASGRVLEIWGNSQPIQPGEGTATVELGLIEVASYGSSKIVVCMYAEGAVSRSFCQEFNYTKSWIVRPSPTPRPSR